MPAVSIALIDLAPFAPDLDATKAAAMIADATAMAELVAPCISSADLSEKKAAAAKAILRAAILRWHDSGNGAVSQQVAGPFQQVLDTRQQRRSLFWPTEIEQLQKICQADSTGGRAWGYDGVGWDTPQHAEICALNFGADYCSCGAVLCGTPLYENGGA